MLEIISTLIGIGLAFAASKWSYARTLLTLARQGLELAKSTGLDTRIPENVRKVAERAIIEANQREIDAVVARLIKAEEESKLEEQRALERGRAMHEQFFETEILPRDGTEKWSSPWKDKQQ